MEFARAEIEVCVSIPVCVAMRRGSDPEQAMEEAFPGMAADDRVQGELRYQFRNARHFFADLEVVDEDEAWNDGGYAFDPSGRPFRFGPR